jgi:hypothetical protein
MEAIRNVYKKLTGKVVGKRSHGRHGVDEGIILMGITEKRVGIRTGFIWHRAGRWWAFVNTVMNVRVPCRKIS